jgi:hypothetical protein
LGFQFSLKYKKATTDKSSQQANKISINFLAVPFPHFIRNTKKKINHHNKKKRKKERKRFEYIEAKHMQNAWKHVKGLHKKDT